MRAIGTGEVVRYNYFGSLVYFDFDRLTQLEKTYGNSVIALTVEQFSNLLSRFRTQFSIEWALSWFH